MHPKNARPLLAGAFLLATFPAATRAASPLSHKVILTDGQRTVVRTRKELGFALASPKPVRFTVNRAALKDALQRIAPKFRQEAVNAKPYVYRGQVRIDPGSYARALNVPTTAEQIARSVSQNPGDTKFTVALDKKPPVLTADRLKGINGVLATMTTSTSANAKRNHNIRVASQSIDGTLLSPGETFSLNKIVGERSHETGFLTAPVFVNAEKVPGIGGGVSQVTGTLFNAAALAGLKIDEVNPHSRPVSYLPLGRDATVAYGDKDLKFTNNTGQPVYVAMSHRNQRLTATIFGSKVQGRRVALRPKVQRLAPGKVNAQLYRVVKENGKVVGKDRLFNHAYRWDPKDKGA